jgi:hypothetical protein
MKRIARCAVLTAALVLIALTSSASAMELTPSPAIAKGVAASPRLPADSPAARRIDQALDRADAWLRDAVKDCLADDSDPSNAEWTRQVVVTMRGPRYLGLLAHDELNCGGPYPDTGTLVLTYDLATGSPMNWAQLLPAAMVQAVGKDDASEGAVTSTLQSHALVDIYVKGLDQPIDPDCRDVVSNPELSLVLWPDAKEDGVAVMPSSLPHVVAACGPDITIPTATLRQLGVDAGLLDAIDTAHAQGLYDKDPP